ncbi:MAG: hypothetical protein Q8P86_00330 [bacterium]|nr:hypothetical protein [bacterium]
MSFFLNRKLLFLPKILIGGLFISAFLFLAVFSFLNAQKADAAGCDIYINHRPVLNSDNQYEVFTDAESVGCGGNWSANFQTDAFFVAPTSIRERPESDYGVEFPDVSSWSVRGLTSQENSDIRLQVDLTVEPDSSVGRNSNAISMPETDLTGGRKYTGLQLSSGGGSNTLIKANMLNYFGNYSLWTESSAKANYQCQNGENGSITMVVQTRKCFSLPSNFFASAGSDNYFESFCSDKSYDQTYGSISCPNESVPTPTLIIGTAPVARRLSVVIDGNGTGVVRSNPPGISCENDCEETFTNGLEIELTATPNSDSNFFSWSSNCTPVPNSPNKCRVVVDSDKTVVVKFFKTTENNPVSGALTCGIPSPNSVTLLYNYENGSDVTLWNGGSLLLNIGSGSGSGSFTQNGLLELTPYTFYLRNGTSANSTLLSSINCSPSENPKPDLEGYINPISGGRDTGDGYVYSGNMVVSGYVKNTGNAPAAGTFTNNYQYKLSSSSIWRDLVNSSLVSSGEIAENGSRDVSPYLGALGGGTPMGPGTWDFRLCANRALEGRGSTISEKDASETSNCKNFVSVRVRNPVLSVQRSDGGSVSADNGTPINCGTQCVDEFAPNSDGSAKTVNLTANPNGGYNTVWLNCPGNASGNTCSNIVMDVDRTVSVSFVRQNEYSLSISVLGTGSGSVTSSSGINCGKTGGVCVKSFTEGAQVTLTASADAGSRSVIWAGACLGVSSSSCTLTINSNTDVSATFHKQTGRVNVSSVLDGAGYIGIPVSALSSQYGGNTSYNFNLPVGVSETLSVTTPINNKAAGFKAWSGCDSSLGLNCNVSVSDGEIQNVTANFVTPTVDLRVNGNKSILVKKGDPITFSWASSEVSSCPVNTWSGRTSAQNLSGDVVYAPQVAGTYPYNISCSGTGGSEAADVVYVTVDDAGTVGLTLTCGAVTTNSVYLGYSFSNGTNVSLFRGNDLFQTFGGTNGSGQVTDTGRASGTSYTYYLRNGSNSSATPYVSVTCTTETAVSPDLTATVTGFTGRGTGNANEYYAGNFAINGRIDNRGNGSAPGNFSNHYRYSLGGGAYSGNWVSAPLTSSATLSAGGFRSVVQYPQDPNRGWIAGSSGSTEWYFMLCADTGSGVSESNESNNCSLPSSVKIVNPKLTVSKNGNPGTVTSNPSGIQCGSTCSAEYAPTDTNNDNVAEYPTVTLTASPTTATDVMTWVGCESLSFDRKNCSVSMSAHKNVSVTFSDALSGDKKLLTVILQGEGGGSVTGSASSGSINCSKNSIQSANTGTCSSEFNFNSTVNLSATANNESIFYGWGPNGACSGTNPNCSVNMSDSKFAVAYFVLNPIQAVCSPSQASVPLGGSVTWRVTSYSGGNNSTYGFSWSGTEIPTNPAPSGTSYNKTYNNSGTKTASVTVVSGNQSRLFSCGSVSVVPPEVKLSDLQSSISISGPKNSAGQFIEGTFTYGGRISNFGEADASPISKNTFYYRLENRSNPEPLNDKSGYLPFLYEVPLTDTALPFSPGEGRAVSPTQNPGGAGLWSIMLCADMRLEEVSESNENNNCSAMPLDIYEEDPEEELITEEGSGISCASSASNSSIFTGSHVTFDGYYEEEETDSANDPPHEYFYSWLLMKSTGEKSYVWGGPEGYYHFATNVVADPGEYSLSLRVYNKNSQGHAISLAGQADCGNVTVSSNDYDITAFTCPQINSGSLVVGEQVDFIGKIKNLGKEIEASKVFSNNFVICENDTFIQRHYAECETPGVPRKSLGASPDIRGMLPGQEETVTSRDKWTVVANEPGKVHTVVLFADSNPFSNNIAESNESNNWKACEFTVAGPPTVDLKVRNKSVGGSYLNSTSVDWGDQAELQWTTTGITTDSTGGSTTNTCQSSITEGVDTSWSTFVIRPSLSVEPHYHTGNNLSRDTTYKISCYNLIDPNGPNQESNRQRAEDTVTVLVGPEPPSVDLRARAMGSAANYSDPAEVPAGMSVQFEWFSRGDYSPNTRCEAKTPSEPGFVGEDLRPNETAVEGEVMESNKVFEIECTDENRLSNDPERIFRDTVNVNLRASSSAPPTFEEF